MIQFCRTAFLGIALFLIGAAPPVFAASAPGGGGTTVTVDGPTVTITVHIDLCCVQGASERDVWAPLIAAEVEAAQDMWNQALAEQPAKGCYDIKVVFDARVLNKGDPWDPGYHEINMKFGQRGMSYSDDFWASAATSDDNTAYINTTTGTFYVVAMDEFTWAHEIGHLMGLGDDYTKDGCLVGRGDTLMCGPTEHGPNKIDQQLADRLADILNSDGLLPQCWKGMLSGHAQGNVYNDTALVQFTFTVGADGTVKGKGHAKMTHAPQVFLGCTLTRTQTPDEFDVDIGGRRDGGEFKLDLSTTARATLQATASSCKRGLTGTGPAVPGLNAFTGFVTAWYHPNVSAEDGATNDLHGVLGDIDVTDHIEIHETSKAATPRNMKSDNSEKLEYLR